MMDKGINLIEMAKRAMDILHIIKGTSAKESYMIFNMAMSVKHGPFWLEEVVPRKVDKAPDLKKKEKNKTPFDNL